jgi:hypothetical protein
MGVARAGEMPARQSRAVQAVFRRVACFMSDFLVWVSDLGAIFSICIIGYSDAAEYMFGYNEATIGN